MVTSLPSPVFPSSRGSSAARYVKLIMHLQKYLFAFHFKMISQSYPLEEMTNHGHVFRQQQSRESSPTSVETSPLPVHVSSRETTPATRDVAVETVRHVASQGTCTDPVATVSMATSTRPVLVANRGTSPAGLIATRSMCVGTAVHVADRGTSPSHLPPTTVSVGTSPIRIEYVHLYNNFIIYIL